MQTNMRQMRDSDKTKQTLESRWVKVNGVLEMRWQTRHERRLTGAIAA